MIDNSRIFTRADLGGWFMQFSIGDIVEMRKKHPCGSYQWEILRVGMDFRLKCIGCGRLVMLPRPKFEKRLKKIIKSAAENV